MRLSVSHILPTHTWAVIITGNAKILWYLLNFIDKGIVLGLIVHKLIVQKLSIRIRLSIERASGCQHTLIQICISWYGKMMSFKRRQWCGKIFKSIKCDSYFVWKMLNTVFSTLHSSRVIKFMILFWLLLHNSWLWVL